MDSTEKILNSMVDILKHIKDVQSDVITLSKDSVVNISNFLSENSITPSEKVMESLQYQDIVSQQLSATIEAIEAIEKNINIYLHALKQDSGIINDGFGKLQDRLTKSLSEAKSKKDSYSGKALGSSQESEEIEFF